MHEAKTGGMIFCGMNEAYVVGGKKQRLRFVINGGQVDCERRIAKGKHSGVEMETGKNPKRNSNLGWTICK